MTLLEKIIIGLVVIIGVTLSFYIDVWKIKLGSQGAVKQAIEEVKDDKSQQK